MSKSLTEAVSTAQHLLELHLQHEMAAFDDASLSSWLAEETLDVLLDNLDISSELLIQEVARFSPQLLVGLKQSGHLEAIIRRRLSSFYTSICRPQLPEGGVKQMIKPKFLRPHLCCNR